MTKKKRKASPRDTQISIRISKAAYNKMSKMAKEEKRTLVAFVDMMMAV